MSKLIIGLTGGIGSGKSSVSEDFEKLGITVVDADIIARDVVNVGTTALAAIHARFGDNVLLDNGQLNREQLRTVVFSEKKHKQWLDNLLHPLIRTEMVQQTRAASSCYCILSVPLLIENKLTGLVDKVVVVDVDEKLQLSRACARDDSDESIIRNIMASQTDRATRLKVADYVINNNASKRELMTQVQQLHETFTQLSTENQ
ncbi:MAG: dephospho-CoA kinase [Glaciecola sp.]